MKTAIIGMGNMGSKYARMILEDRIPGMELSAATRIRPERMEQLKDVLPDNFRFYNSGELLYEAFDRGELNIDTVLVVTPHYSHEELVLDAFARGLNVLCDKPAGAYSRQAREMDNAYTEALKSHPGLLYGFIFHQRTFPVYQKIKEIVDSGKYGSVKRVSWMITDWYRPNAYYGTDAWRATWKGDGGGTLLNQCPHNLDLLQWICGMPINVQAFCHEGKFHPIEVEDEVTAYLEWESGATGVFVASTGEAPGVNRLEIALSDALLICESGKLRLCALDKPENEYRKETQDLFAKPKGLWSDVETKPSDGAYEKLLSAFAEGHMIASGDEAIHSLFLSNAMYLSSWERRMVHIPKRYSAEEIEFENSFETWLARKSKSE